MKIFGGCAPVPPEKVSSRIFMKCLWWLTKPNVTAWFTLWLWCYFIFEKFENKCKTIVYVTRFITGFARNVTGFLYKIPVFDQNLTSFWVRGVGRSEIASSVLVAPKASQRFQKLLCKPNATQKHMLGLWAEDLLLHHWTLIETLIIQQVLISVHELLVWPLGPDICLRGPFGL